MSLNPDKIPIIIRKDPYNNQLVELPKFKFLIGKNEKISTFNKLLCKYLKISLENFQIQTSDGLPVANDEDISNVYLHHKDDGDGFLYLQYTYEIPEKVQEIEKNYNTNLNNLPKLTHKFKEQFNFETRLKEANAIFKKMPKNVPIIVEKYPLSKLFEIEKSKYICAGTILLESFMKKVFEKLNYDYNNIIFINENNEDLSSKILCNLNEIYNLYKSEDKILYLFYIEKNLLPNNLNSNNDQNIDPNYNNTKTNYYSSVNKIVDDTPQKPNYENTNYNNANYNDNYIDNYYDDYTNQYTFQNSYNNNNNFDGNNNYQPEPKVSMPPSNFNDNSNVEKNPNLNFKQQYSLEERQNKFYELCNKSPDKIFVVFIKKDQPIKLNGKIYKFHKKSNLESIKVKLWEELNKPSYDIILINAKNEILKNSMKLTEIYEKSKDPEDGFLYLYYQFNEQLNKNLEAANPNVNNMTEGEKIYTMFKKIPVFFKKGPNCSEQYKDKKIMISENFKTFNEVFSFWGIDNTYLYYDYPNGLIDNNEVIEDVYFKYRNNQDNILYLTYTNNPTENVNEVPNKKNNLFNV